MTDRTAKFLSNQKLKTWVKSWLQPVDNIEKADFVILQDPKSINASVIFKEKKLKDPLVSFIPTKNLHTTSL